MDHEIELKDSALTEAEKITFIEKVYNAKVAETKLIKKGKYYYIKGWEGNQWSPLNAVEAFSEIDD